MPVLVNGEPILNDPIREEGKRLRQRPEWRDLPDGVETSMRVRQEAELRMVDRVLLRQEAEKDSRPMDPAIVDGEIERLKTENGGCRGSIDEGFLRRQIEGDLRCKRTVEDLMGPIPALTEAEIARFYKTEGRNFRRPEMVQAAHIVRHVDGGQTEEEARAGIEAALADLQRGEPFAAVVERYSDCKDNGGDLGFFPRGQMVDEIDSVVFAMKPGQRSPVFRSPFGFRIAEVRARQPEGVAPLAEVRNTIAEFLTAMKERDAFRRVLGDLRAKADIRHVSARHAGASAE
jgi:hypothetical protein